MICRLPPIKSAPGFRERCLSARLKMFSAKLFRVMRSSRSSPGSAAQTYSSAFAQPAVSAERFSGSRRTTSTGAMPGSTSFGVISRQRRQTWRSLSRPLSQVAPIASDLSAASGSAVPLAMALRQHLEAMAQARTVEANRSQARGEVYEYICGLEFKHRVTNTVAAAIAMKADLDAERRAAERLFAKREKLIDAQIQNRAAMYGELQAIVGGALQPVAALELPPPSDEEPGPLALAS